MTSAPRAGAGVEEALRAAGLPPRIVSASALAGGCVDGARKLVLADGRAVVAKAGPPDAAARFEAEAAGLRALRATRTVRVPAPLGFAATAHGAALVMEWVQPGGADAAAWRAFGADLARLHAADAGARYGFESDNFLGATAQPNGWCDDWVRFNVERRLQHQAALAGGRGLLHAGERARIDTLCARLDGVLPRRPKPALLHGDLWAGNALPGADGRVAAIDPAVHVGDGWADVAMMRLFGGFPPACLQAYAEAVSDHDGVDERIAVYQLYHVLNHVNLFGRGYAAQAMTLLSRLGC